jgi:hypothetical protein
MTSPEKSWQVQVNEKVYEANFDELCQWIIEGAVLPHDKVRRGNLRWLEAEKVPELHGFFNLSPFEQSQTNVTWTTNETHAVENKIENFANTPPPEPAKAEHLSVFCTVHAENETVYVCDTCLNSFCKICPKSYGGVKLCPLCGALCRLFSETPDEKKALGAVFKPYAANHEEKNYFNPEDALKQLGFAATLRSMNYAVKQMSQNALHKILHPADSLKSFFRREKKLERLPRYFDPDK